MFKFIPMVELNRHDFRHNLLITKFEVQGMQFSLK